MKSLCRLCFYLTALILTACGSSDGGSRSSSVASSSSVSIASSSASSESSSQSSVADTGCPDGKHIVGYFPTWQGRVADIQYSFLTHIMYSFVLPNSNGSLQAMEPASISKLQELVNRAHGEGVKVGIAVGGWNDGDDSAFVALANNPLSRATFVNALVDFVVTYNLDGVDMDWEYPSTPAEANNFTLMMGELRAALDQLAGTKFLTAAVIAQGNWNGQYIQNAVFEYVDFLNIMAYDENNSNHSSLTYALTSIDYWINRGLSRDKLVLGVPFYARPSWSAYNTYVAADAKNACVDAVNGNFYNGIPTIRTKAALAHTSACGVMMWELSHDTTGDSSLLKAIWEVVNGQAQTYQCP